MTCNSCPKVAVLHAKTTDDGWHPYTLLILIQKSQFCMQKPHMSAGNMETSDSDANHFVLNAKNHR